MGTEFRTLDDALANFDYERVVLVMDTLKWRWNKRRVGVAALYSRVFESPSMLSSASGGFELRRIPRCHEDYQDGYRFELVFDVGQLRDDA